MNDFDPYYFQRKIVNYLYDRTDAGKTRMTCKQMRAIKKEVGRALNFQFNKVEVVGLIEIWMLK
jgi:hypothetical protein